jgi:PAS domain S-box-containing protein
MREEMDALRNGLHAATVSHLARRLSEAETSLVTLTRGGVDAVLDSTGSPYLLRAAQQRSRQNESRAQALLDSVPDVIIATDDAGKILFQSAAVTRVLSYDVQEIIGRNLFELVHASSVRQLYHAYFAVVESFTASSDVDVLVSAHDRSWRMFEATVGRLVSHPDLKGVIVSLRNPSARRKNQEYAAHQKNALEMSRFLVSLCKELQKPLAPALMGLRQMLNDSPSVEFKPALDIIRQQLERQSDLIDELLAFSREQKQGESDDPPRDCFVG